LPLSIFLFLYQSTEYSQSDFDISLALFLTSGNSSNLVRSEASKQLLTNDQEKPTIISRVNNFFDNTDTPSPSSSFKESPCYPIIESESDETGSQITYHCKLHPELGYAFPFQVEFHCLNESETHKSEIIRILEQKDTTTQPTNNTPSTCIFCHNFSTSIDYDMVVHMYTNHRSALLDLQIAVEGLESRIQYAINEGRQNKGA
jgi:hypothetical protein